MIENHFNFSISQNVVKTYSLTPLAQTKIQEELTQLDNVTNRLAYLKSEYKPSSLTVTGESLCGYKATHTVVIPDYLINPPELDFNDYPFDIVIRGEEITYVFKDDHPYNYITTFDVTQSRKLMKQLEDKVDKDPTDVARSAIIKSLISKFLPQSRNSTSIKQLCVLRFLAELFDDGLIFQRHVNVNNAKSKTLNSRIVARKVNNNFQNIILTVAQTLVKGWTDFPYSERADEMIWHDVNFKVCSQTPLLLMGLVNLMIEYCTGIVTELDCAFIIQYWLDSANKSLQDEMLKNKSTLRNGLRTRLSRLKEDLMPRFDTDGELLGVSRHEYTELQTVIDDDNELKAEISKLLRPELLAYYSFHNTLPDVDHCIHSHMLFRIMSNMGLYYKSVIDLATKDAVNPRRAGKIVPYPREKLYYDNNVLRYKIESSDNTICKWWMSAYGPKVREVRDRLARLDFQERFVQLLTTSSAGQQLNKEAADELFGNKNLSSAKDQRVVAFAYQMSTLDTSESLLNLASILRQLSSRKAMVVRHQIDRRMRDIVGVNNAMTMATAPVMLILKRLEEHYSIFRSGKQQGNVHDFGRVLHAACDENVYFDSADINAMDASYQQGLEMILLSFCGLIAEGLNVANYFGYSKKFVNVVDGTSHAQKWMNAIQECISSLISGHFYSINAIGKSQVFQDQDIASADPTFGSGLMHTGDNHSTTTAAAVIGQQIEAAKNGHLQSLMTTEVMGDDMRMTFIGSSDSMLNDYKVVGNALDTCGFEMRSQLSHNFCEFLQQAVCAGRLLPYPDRVSLATIERRNADNISSRAQMKVLNSLMPDLGCRVRFPECLRYVQLAFWLFCGSSITLRVKKQDADAIVKSYFGKQLLVRKLTPEALGFKDKSSDMANNQRESKINKNGSGGNKQSAEKDDFVLIRATIPIIEATLESGAQIPPLSLRRRDGSWTTSMSYYITQGSMNRYQIFDVSFTDEMWESMIEADNKKRDFRHPASLIDTTALLDIALLHEYKVPASYLISELSLDDIKVKELNANNELSNAIDKHGRKLDVYLDQHKYRLSRFSYNYLKRNGISIDDSIVYSEATVTRLRQAVAKQALKFRPDVTKEISIAVRTILKFSERSMIEKKVEDNSMLFRVYVGDTQSNLTLQKELETVSLSPEYHQGSQISELLAYFSPSSNVSAVSISVLNAIQDKYGKNMNNKILEEAIRIQNIAMVDGKPELLERFFSAVGLHSSEFDKITRSMEFFKNTAQAKFPVIYSPRKMFFFSVSPTLALRNLEMDPRFMGLNPNSQSLLLTIAFSVITSRCHVMNYSRKLRIEMPFNHYANMMIRVR